MAETKKASPPDLSKMVKVKNESRKMVGTSKGVINPGDSLEIPLVEARQFNKYLTKA